MAGNLYIKYGAADTGARPIPANTPFWTSPSIWLDTLGNTTATVNVKTPVRVQVDRMNGSSETGTASVQAWVTHSTTQPGPSGAVLSSAGGSSGLSQVLGGPASYPQVASMDWTPWPGDEDQPGVFHSCVSANVYILLGDPEGNQLTTGFIDPVHDQHHGQLNISIVTAPAPQKMIRFPFRVPASLLAAERTQESVIRVNPLGPDTVLSGVIQEQLLASPLIELSGAQAVPETSVPFGCLNEPLQRAMLRGGGELVLAKSEKKTPVFASERQLREIRILADGTAKPEQVVKSHPGAIVPMVAEVELPDDRVGAVYEFDITQAAAGGHVVGGIRVVVVRGHHWW